MDCVQENNHMKPSTSGNSNEETMKEKQLKVDNWGSFFLHRLYLLYEKGESCDATLLFSDGPPIKAHKLVLVTCSEFFSEQTWLNDSFALQPVLKHNAVLPIINFMYTGFLDFNSESHHSVFTAAKFLKVTILIKLLNTQSAKSDAIKDATSTPTSSGTVLPTLSAAPGTTASVLRKVKKTSTSSLSSAAAITTLALAAAPTPQTTLPGKKLPFWKKRTTPSGGLFVAAAGGGDGGAAAILDSSHSYEPCEPALPTRFDWPDDECDELRMPMPTAECPRYNSISYTSELLVRPVDHKRPPIQQLTTEINEISKKRPHQESEIVRGNFIHNSDDDDDDDDDRHFDPDHNSTELIADEMRDTYPSSSSTSSLSTTQVERRNVNGGGSSSSSEDAFNRLAKTSLDCSQTPITPPKPILKPLTSDSVPMGGSSKKVRFSLAAEGKENTELTNSVSSTEVTIKEPISPAIKIVTKELTAGIGVKDNVIVKNSSPIVPNNSSDIASRLSITGDKSANHVKIISEVMKKYPDLMKNNKNIKLKIIGNNAKSPSSSSSSAVAVDKEAETKVSYVVMKSAADAIKEASAVAEGSGGGRTQVTSQSSGAENMAGPWLCSECGVGGKPMNFDTYYLYRRHLHDVHQERIDARICEYCGHKSSKRNLHLYHLYTKHGVAPPRNIRFPKCDKCNYIALSDSLLIKHKNNHATSVKAVYCKAPSCNMSFNNQAALQYHMQTCVNIGAGGGGSEQGGGGTGATPIKEYRCEYCQMPFNRSINLKAHMRTTHKDESRRLYDEEEEEASGASSCITSGTVDTNGLLQVIRVPVMDANDPEGTGGGQRTLFLPASMFLTAAAPGVAPDGSQVVAADVADAAGTVVTATAASSSSSSESEAMNNVASGIAASLNLADGSLTSLTDQTVILLDAGTSELVFAEHGSSVMLAQDGAGGVQEYIVPEIMATGDNVSRIFRTADGQTHSVIVSDAATAASPLPHPQRRRTADHTYAGGHDTNNKKARRADQQQQQQQLVLDEPMELDHEQDTVPVVDESMVVGDESKLVVLAPEDEEQTTTHVVPAEMQTTHVVPAEMQTTPVVPAEMQTTQVIPAEMQPRIDLIQEDEHSLAVSVGGGITCAAVGTPGQLAPADHVKNEPPFDTVAADPLSIATNCTNIVEEACKRDTIIIETSSVSHTHSLSHQSPSQCGVVGGVNDSVIVATPKLDLTKDWDDFEPTDEDGDGHGGASLPTTTNNDDDDSSDDVRPSRPTIDMEETILPDM